MEFGAQLYTVREFTQTPEALEKTLQKVSAMGYKNVHCSKLGSIEPERLRDLLQANHLKCVVTHANADQLFNDLPEVIRMHRTIGCENVGLSIMPEKYRGSLEGLRALIADLKPILAQLQDAGLKFHYHNHDVEFIRVGNQTLLDILLSELPDAQLLLCAFWAQAGGADSVEIIRRYGERINFIHVKDMVYKKGLIEVGQGRTMAPVLDGNMNYPAILEACRREKAIQCVIVEQDICEEDPFICLEKGLHNLEAWRDGRK